MIYLITFAYGNIYESVQKLFDSSLDILGADRHVKYSAKDIIGTKFYENNKKIFSIKKGFGLYIWKPYIIYDQLSKIEYGDYIFYCDCSRHFPTGFTCSIRPAIEYMENKNIDIMPGNFQMVENEYGSSDYCIYRIKQDHNFDVEKYKKTMQQCAGHIIIKKTNFSIKFVDEWLKYCQIEPCIKKTKTKKGFNNCDMSIFNILLFIYGIKNPNQPLLKEDARNHNIFLSRFS
ncbi:MAG: hypothetical protein QW303_04915 [Nitrososphaerota archaeon]